MGRSPPLQNLNPGSGVPEGTRDPKQRGTEFWTFVGSVHRVKLESSKKKRIERNINFSNLASCMFFLFSEVDLTQRPGQIWANFGRKLRFFESRQDRSRIIRGSSRSHLEVIWGSWSASGRVLNFFKFCQNSG